VVNNDPRDTVSSFMNLRVAGIQALGAVELKGKGVRDAADRPQP
jgi:hypothetical protein